MKEKLMLNNDQMKVIRDLGITEKPRFGNGFIVQELLNFLPKYKIVDNNLYELVFCQSELFYSGLVSGYREHIGIYNKFDYPDYSILDFVYNALINIDDRSLINTKIPNDSLVLSEEQMKILNTLDITKKPEIASGFTMQELIELLPEERYIYNYYEPTKDFVIRYNKANEVFEVCYMSDCEETNPIESKNLLTALYCMVIWEKISL